MLIITYCLFIEWLSHGNLDKQFHWFQPSLTNITRFLLIIPVRVPFSCVYCHLLMFLSAVIFRIFIPSLESLKTFAISLYRLYLLIQKKQLQTLQNVVGYADDDYKHIRTGNKFTLNYFFNFLYYIEYQYIFITPRL